MSISPIDFSEQVVGKKILKIIHIRNRRAAMIIFTLDDGSKVAVMHSHDDGDVMLNGERIDGRQG